MSMFMQTIRALQLQAEGMEYNTSLYYAVARSLCLKLCGTKRSLYTNFVRYIVKKFAQKKDNC